MDFLENKVRLEGSIFYKKNLFTSSITVLYTYYKLYYDHHNLDY